MRALWLVCGALMVTACAIRGPTDGAETDDEEGSDATSGPSSSSAGGSGAVGSGAGPGGGVTTGTSSAATGGGEENPGLPVLGGNAHTSDAVELLELGSQSDGLRSPSDAAFHPTVSGQLWVTNRADDSMTIFSDLGGPGQSSSTRRDSWSGPHFLANPSGLAFGDNGMMATIHDEDQPTQGSATPWDFMGPTLWPSSASAFDGGDASHMDMLHNTPSGMGIAWESGNAYWVFDGEHSAITRYDFRVDHGPGGSDHTDGVVARYVEGQVKRVPDVPSNLVYDPATAMLYIADSGNNRVAVLDTQTGTPGGNVYPNYDGTDQYRVDGAQLTTLIAGADFGMQRPSGLEIRDGIIFVTDNATATIYGFDMSGSLIDWLDTGLAPGCLAGMTLDTHGRIVVVDAPTHRVLRIAPKAAPGM